MAEPYKSPFLTFNGLTIRWAQDEEKMQTVTIEGDYAKLLYFGPNFGAAGKVFRDTCEHYERRAEQEKP